jgi:type II secretory pathway component PulF
MKCSRCDNAIEETAVVCGACASSRSAVWSNVYAVLLLATVGLIDAVFVSTTVPGLVEAFSRADQALPLSLRILVTAGGVAVRLALGVVVAGGAVAAIMRHKRVRIPVFVKDGAMLWLAAWVTVAGSLIALAVAAGHLRPVG